MSIVYEKQTRRFLLSTPHTTYIMELVKDGFLAHVYWGKRLHSYHGSNQILYRDRGFCPNIYEEDRTFSLDTLPQEYPQYGNGDYRPCAYQVRNAHNDSFSDLRYQSHEIIQGKENLQQLPSAHAKQDEATTLILHMCDPQIGLHVDLNYSVFEDCDVIVRSVRFYADEDLLLTKMLSANVDIRSDQFDLITMYGAHNNDRNLDRRALHSGSVVVESMRGASSPHQTPFIALISKQGNEHHGDVYAMQFIYSGNFQALVHVDPYRNVRMQMGLQPFDNEWQLTKGTYFETPEVVLQYSSDGLSNMSHQLHTFVSKHIVSEIWKDRLRPILINNWEATYFQFNEQKLLSLAKESASLGIELFVLDDGWFLNRKDDTRALGDWIVDSTKLPHGLAWLSDQIHAMGLQFGLWFEPEMINENSLFYREHPTYVMGVQGRKHVTGRGQLVLDLSAPCVCDEVVNRICKVLSSAKIDYVKWDMNRHLTNIGSSFHPASKQREIAHRYMLGVYDIMNRITTAFPDILFESCSSGGGRFDLGMLCYMPQTWTSDNTDAICRAKIQYATSYMMPAITMGSHVSVCPNHQTGRMTPMDTRYAIAMSGNFGYELDLTSLSIQEKAVIQQQIIQYKQYRPLIQTGMFYRLLNPFEGNEAAWCFVNEEQTQVLVVYVKILSEPAAPFHILKLHGLDPTAIYQEQTTNLVYSGEELLYAGISIPNTKEDFHSEQWYFIKEE